MAELIGNAAKPNGAGGWEAWSSTWNMASELLIIPERGRLTRVGVWTAGVGESATAYLCIWSAATGALLGESAAIVLGSEPSGSGNVNLYAADLVTPVELDSGSDFLAGFWRAPTKSHQLTGRSSGAHFDKKASGRSTFAPPRNTGGHGFGAYSVGIHAYYEPTSGAWVRRGGATIRADEIQVRRGGAWSIPDRVSVRRGGAWVDAE